MDIERATRALLARIDHVRECRVVWTADKRVERRRAALGGR
jgi:hypothetical protein